MFCAPLIEPHVAHLLLSPFPPRLVPASFFFFSLYQGRSQKAKGCFFSSSRKTVSQQCNCSRFFTRFRRLFLSF